MLYWICPECGHECSPAIRECPTCTAPPESTKRDSAVPEQEPVQRPAPQREGAGQGLLALAENFQSASSVGLLAPPMVAVEEPVEPAAKPATNPLVPREPQLSYKLEPLDILAVEAARPRRSEQAKLISMPVPVRISSPAAPAAVLPRAQFGIQPAGPVPSGEINFHAAPWGNSHSHDQPAEPLPSPRRQSVAFVRAELPGVEHGRIAFADLAQLIRRSDDKPLKPVVPHQNGQPGDGVSTPLSYKPGDPSLVSSRLQLGGESLAELLNALKMDAEKLDEAAIHAIQESFHDQPEVGLLSAPAEIVTPPAPPAAQWMRSAKPKFTPIAPEHAGSSTVIAGPQAPTIAGPSLPPQLVNFSPHAGLRRNRKRLSAWPISLLVATVLILGVGSLLQFMTPDRDTKAASVEAPALIKPAPTRPVRVVEEHPAARSVEVAGVRIVTGPNKKPQLQYIVINHSASEITGLNVRIAVRSVEALSDEPLFSVSSVVASLGPNQSKEIRTDLDPSVTPSAIPDWHSLRTEVLVARQ